MTVIARTPVRPGAPARSARTRMMWWLVVAIALLAVWWAGREIAPRLLAIVARIHTLGAAAPIMLRCDALLGR